MLVWFSFRFPAGAQTGQGPQGPDGCVPSQQAMAQVQHEFSFSFSKIIQKLICTNNDTVYLGWQTGSIYDKTQSSEFWSRIHQ